MASPTTLPVEVVNLILSYVCDDAWTFPTDPQNSSDISFLHNRSFKHLLRLRLLSRSWAIAVPPFVYRSLSLRVPWVNGYLVKMWENSITPSIMKNLERLCLDRVMYFPALNTETLYGLLPDSSRAEMEYEYENRESNWIMMEDAANIIELCGQNLSELKLKFAYTVGFSCSMVVAMKHINCLKTLIIEGTQVRNIMNDSGTIEKVLNSTENLESLSLKLATLHSLSLEPKALPNLTHLMVTCHPWNINTINHFCHHHGQQIRLLEYQPAYDANYSARMVEELGENLEGLFITTVPKHVPTTLQSVSFPKLRVVRCMNMGPARGRPTWLQWVFFANVEVFITHYENSKAYWKEMLEAKNRSPIEDAVNLKYIIFITNNPVAEDPELIAMFEECKICCVLRPKMSVSEVLSYGNETDDRE